MSGSVEEEGPNEMPSINVIGSQARLVLMRKKQRTLMHMTVEEELIWV
jgi:hypothetical protein